MTATTRKKHTGGVARLERHRVTPHERAAELRFAIVHERDPNRKRVLMDALHQVQRQITELKVIDAVTLADQAELAARKAQQRLVAARLALARGNGDADTVLDAENQARHAEEDLQAALMNLFFTRATAHVARRREDD